jgi:transposase-like protein
MPWTELSKVSLRQEFVVLASAPGADVRGLCRRFGISPKTGYKWIRRAGLPHRP